MRGWALCAAIVVASGAGAAEACAPSQLDLRGAFGSLRFAVEIADAPAERAQGLMHRESLPQFSGMLFVYEDTRRVSMWMKNTRIPLDMIFIGSDGVVAHVHENAVPGDLTSIPAPMPVRAVLEVNGGLTRSLGIAVGDEIRHPAFGPDAAWPCAD